jgi:hypothetical protein
MGDKAGTTAKKRKFETLADRFNLANHGPELTEEQKEEKKRKELDSVAKNLAVTSGFKFSSVPFLCNTPEEPLDLSLLPKTNRSSSHQAIVSSVRHAPSDFTDETIHKHIMKTYVDQNIAPNFQAVADKFGLSKNAPRRMFDRHILSLQKEEDPIPSIRSSTLDIKSKRLLLEEVDKFRGAKQEQRNEKNWKAFIDELRLKHLLETEPNADADSIPKLDKRTYETIFELVLPDKSSTTKQLGNGRIDAQQVPHNAISCCALVEATFNDTAKEAIFSSDMFTVYIDPTSNKAQYVRCPEGTLAALRAMNLTPGYEEKGETLHLGKCALPAFMTFDPNGDVLSKIMFFIDKFVPIPEDGKYCLYPLESDGSHKNPVRNSRLFAAVLPYQFDEDKLFHQIWSLIIIPKTDSRCYDLMRLELRGQLQKLRTPTPTPESDRELPDQSTPGGGINLANCSSRSIPEPPGQRRQRSSENDDLMRKLQEDPTWCSHLRSPVHCMDGDNPNINAIMSSSKMAAYGLRSLSDICADKKFIKIRFLKWAAGCSFTMSPNDVSSAHRDVKKETGAGSVMQTVAVSMDELTRPVAKFIHDVMTIGVGKG